MEKLKCIIHYPIKEGKYSKIKTISEINEEKIYAAKKHREELGGQNYHEEQCCSIPNEIDQESHGIHLEPCYKKFTLILSTRKSTHALDCSSEERTTNNGSTRPKRARVTFTKRIEKSFSKRM